MKNEEWRMKKMQVLGAWCLVLSAWCLVLGAWCLVLGAWCLVLSAWYFGTNTFQGPRTKNQEPRTKSQEQGILNSSFRRLLIEINRYPLDEEHWLGVANLFGLPVPYTMEDFNRDAKEEFLKILTLEERLKGLPPEERFKGLTVTEIQAYLENCSSNLSQVHPKSPER